MGLYSEGIFEGNWKKIIFSVIIVLIILLIGYLISTTNFNELGSNNISASFNNNPLVLSKNINTILEITIKNNTEIDAINSSLEITPVEDSLIVYCQDSKDTNNQKVIITKMASGNQRTIYCDIRYPEINKILEGTYSFDIKYTINNNNYFKRIKLAVKR